MKKLISIALALTMMASLAGLSMASQLDSLEGLEQEIEKNKVATQQMLENIDKELAEIQQQIKASPNVGRI